MLYMLLDQDLENLFNMKIKSITLVISYFCQVYFGV